MEIERDMVQSAVVIFLSGRLEGEATRQLEAVLLQNVNDGQPFIVVDMERIEFVGSAGLRVLLLAHATGLLKGCRICLCGLKSNNLRLFKLCQMDRVFAIYESLTDALAAGQPPTHPDQTSDS